MMVRSLEDVVGTDRDVQGDGWRSRRLMLASDGMGFSLHDTTVAAGSELELEYRHHLEACYCVEGSAEIEDLASGERHAIGPGVAYALDQHDRHVLRVASDLHRVTITRRGSRRTVKSGLGFTPGVNYDGPAPETMDNGHLA